jgi:hypothetical protein
MARVIVLQRVVPHYRMPIYRRLAEELNWEIVFGGNSNSSAMLHFFTPRNSRLGAGAAPPDTWCPSVTY